MNAKKEVVFLGDGRVEFNSGQILSNVHNDDSCLGAFCPIHNPSDHDLRGLPLFFNGHHMIRIVDEDTEDFTIDPDDYFFNLYGEAIVRNSAICKLCNETIVSRFRHDYVSCSCGEISVDGGTDYLRSGWKHRENFIDNSLVFTKDN